MLATKPKLEKRWGKPHQIIESTPEISKKEAAFLKYGSDMIECSKERNSNYVSSDYEKYLEFEKKYPGKPILRIHTHGTTASQMPSEGDIAILAMDYLKNYFSKAKSKKSNKITQEDLRFAKPAIISVIDEKGKDIGRIHVHLTPKAINILKENFLGMDLQSKILIERNIFENISQIIYAKFLKKFKELPNYTAAQKKVIQLYSTRYYYENVLGLHMHFKPMPGYKYNSSEFKFEKIK